MEPHEQQNAWPSTPFRHSKLDLARLGAAPAGLQMRRYVGGPMTCLDDQVRPALATDLTSLPRDLGAAPRGGG